MKKPVTKSILYPLIGVIILSSVVGGLVWAINTVAEGWRAPLSVLTRIDLRANYGDCKDVTAQAVGDAFVPTKTVAEWNSFKASKPATIRVAACGYSQCTAAGQAYNVAVSGGNACTFNDRIICTGDGDGYTWSMCNVGTNTTGANGNVYQWGRDGAPFNPAGATPGVIAGPQAPTYNAAIFITRPAVSDGNWRTPTDSNDYGGNGTTGNAGTYITQGRPALMQGPCPAGYHVPTGKEWCDTLTAFGAGGVCLATPPYTESGSTANSTANTTLSAMLNIPLSGTRANKTAINYSAGVDAVFWSSTPVGNRSIMVPFNATTVGFYIDDRADGFSIRCIKND